MDLQGDIGGYQCVCLPGYRGRHCELPDSACQHLPCAHGGECVDRANRVECHCPAGWSGPTCQQNVNECLRPVCKNGSACRDHPGTYECLCLPGWTGHDCGTPDVPQNTTIAPPAPETQTAFSSPPKETRSRADLIRCVVVVLVIVSLTLITIIFIVLFVRRRNRSVRPGKAGFEELPRTLTPLRQPTIQSPSQQVYWNASVTKEGLLIFPAASSMAEVDPAITTTHQKDVKSGFEVEKLVAPCKHAFDDCRKPMYYETSARLLRPAQRFLPICPPGGVPRAVVYACQTPPPPYEDLIHTNNNTLNRTSSSS